MTRAQKYLVAMLILAVSVTNASAQVATGAPPFSSLGGGPDVINLGNLNSRITIPVLHKSGRGTGFTYDYSYDTSIWYPVTSSGTTTWQPVQNWGWRGQTEIATGYISVTQSVGSSPFCSTGAWVYTNWVYIMMPSE